MDSDTDYRCWEIMNCDNLDCPARHEPETPCWEISKGGDSYHNVSKNCSDCIVYLLKSDASIISFLKLKNLTNQKDFWEDIGTPHQKCIL
jgi:hypothetical protein